MAEEHYVDLAKPPEFIKFPKIPRYSREAIVTEKIDGTSVQIYIGEDGEFLTGSRRRWITPNTDHYGFSRWAHDHKEELLTLGPGRHSGEWWGGGIQRGYGLQKDDKRFSMFNVIRWCLHDQEPQQVPKEDPRIIKMQDILPPCVGLVPILWRGCFDSIPIDHILEILTLKGSQASRGFMNPEGIVIHHVAGCVSFKKTLKGDDMPKSKLAKGKS